MMVMSDVTLPLAEIKKRLSEIIDGVEQRHDRVVLTRNGRAAAVIVSPQELEALEESLEILSNPKAVREIRKADAEIDRGRFLTAEELREVSQAVKWSLQVAPSAERTLRRLPENVAAAIVEFLVGPLLEEPERVGRPLRRELAGYMSARRGSYRIVYRIVAEGRVVRVVRIEHRADVYRLR